MSFQLSHKEIDYIALIGNPNSGKTTIFNSLTGLRQKVGNYPGVTVEKKEGKISLSNGNEITVLDLPGTYSLSANSPDEKIATDVLLGKSHGIPIPGVIICVLDASNLERNLYLLSQIIDQHIPVIVALNMIDVAERRGIKINIEKLSSLLGVTIIPTVASKQIGISELISSLQKNISVSPFARTWNLPEKVSMEYKELTSLLIANDHRNEKAAYHEAQVLLSSLRNTDSFENQYSPETLSHLEKDYENLSSWGINRHSVFVESRYKWIRQILNECVTLSDNEEIHSLSDRMDAILTHRIWGLIIFFAIMSLMFQTIFSWATIPMNLIGAGFNWIGHQIGAILPPGDLHDLIVNGAIGGVGAVVTFLPQILFLFLFLGILEDSGYMARAAFVMDRVMRKVGLHGRSFIPLLSSFACAIPGIMATRTIENPKDRLVTMLVAPLMSCSARLPVYALMIGTFIPNITVFGIFGLPGLVLISMYILGLTAALFMAWVFKRTLLKSKSSAFVMEFPPYRVPSIKNTFIHMWERAKIFLQTAGTIILGASIILWFLATYPKVDSTNPSERLAHSFVGQAGKIIEPALKPLGFDWKIGIGIISSILQREVFVSTMGTIYNIENGSDKSLSLREQLQKEIDPKTGLPKFTALTALCIMVYYVLAMQCMSTIAVMKRETNGWTWPAFQFAYMTILAYVGTFVTYRIGLWIIS